MQFEDVRFISSVLVILTFGVASHFFAVLDELLPVFARLLATTCVLLLYIWFSVFGQWVSRARRATFNEQNLLLTYQPRAYTHGHLFVPDPPTPALLNSNSGGGGCGESATDSEFKRARDAHYKDEFNMANRASAEAKLNPTMKVESMRIEFDEASSSSSPSSSKESANSPSYNI